MEVEETECFSVNGGLIVHNCMDGNRYSLMTYLKKYKGRELIRQL